MSKIWLFSIINYEKVNFIHPIFHLNSFSYFIFMTFKRYILIKLLTALASIITYGEIYNFNFDWSIFLNLYKNKGLL